MEIKYILLVLVLWNYAYFLTTTIQRLRYFNARRWISSSSKCHTHWLGVGADWFCHLPYRIAERDFNSWHSHLLPPRRQRSLMILTGPVRLRFEWASLSQLGVACSPLGESELEISSTPPNHLCATLLSLLFTQFVTFASENSEIRPTLNLLVYHFAVKNAKNVLRCITIIYSPYLTTYAVILNNAHHLFVV